LSALIDRQLYPLLTDEPQSFNELRKTLKFSDAPIRKTLHEIMDRGKADRVWGRSKAGFICWLYFRCEKRAIVDDIPLEVKLSDLAMSRPWDGNVFEGRA
jgi:predicted transcriptional regulator